MSAQTCQEEVREDRGDVLGNQYAEVPLDPGVMRAVDNVICVCYGAVCVCVSADLESV